MSTRAPRHLFTAFGVELEYMIVDARTLAVQPITDRLLHAVAGKIVAEVELGAIGWSNELALHVVELKTVEPAETLEGLPRLFGQSVRQINDLLGPHQARLMPTAMHPWMDPDREMRLWPHDCSPVYETFHRIFDCRGHGWANLQSVHLNLPFADDAEFARLHAAVRLVLPLLPALAASSPVMEGRLTGIQDNRLAVYRTNARRVPSVSGRVVPEPVYSRAAYEAEILERIYADLEPFDPEGILRNEWVNARGAIARFDRHAIEIRVLDVQECPQSDVAICAAIVAVLEQLVAERWSGFESQSRFSGETLDALMQATTREAEQASVADRSYLELFGLGDLVPLTAGDVWQTLLARTPLLDRGAPFAAPLQRILSQGPLSRRITRALRGDLSRARLAAVYDQLCGCLSSETMLDAGP